MNTITAKVLIVIALVIYIGISGVAQASIEKTTPTAVTKDLQESNQSISATVINEIQKIKILIKENESKFTVLMHQENVDMNELYQNIDESESLHRQLKKFRIQLIKIAIFK